jgi:hypothetical protein
MEVSGHRHASAALPPGMESAVPIVYEVGWAIFRRREKSLGFARYLFMDQKMKMGKEYWRKVRSR